MGTLTASWNDRERSLSDLLAFCGPLPHTILRTVNFNDNSPKPNLSSGTTRTQARMLVIAHIREKIVSYAASAYPYEAFIHIVAGVVRESIPSTSAK